MFHDFAVVEEYIWDSSKKIKEFEAIYLSPTDIALRRYKCRTWRDSFLKTVSLVENFGFSDSDLSNVLALCVFRTSVVMHKLKKHEQFIEITSEDANKIDLAISNGKQCCEFESWFKYHFEVLRPFEINQECKNYVAYRLGQLLSEYRLGDSANGTKTQAREEISRI